MRHELIFVVDAPAAADVRDLGDAFRDALITAQRRGHAEQSALPYSRCRIESIQLTTKNDAD